MKSKWAAKACVVLLLMEIKILIITSQAAKVIQAFFFFLVLGRSSFTPRVFWLKLSTTVLNDSEKESLLYIECNGFCLNSVEAGI